MPKYTKEFKIKLVMEYLSGESGGSPMVAKKYDIREDVMHAHAFRHFFAIQSLNNGVDMSLLKDLLGHGSIDTTQIYTQLSSAEQKKRFNEAVKW